MVQTHTAGNGKRDRPKAGLGASSSLSNCSSTFTNPELSMKNLAPLATVLFAIGVVLGCIGGVFAALDTLAVTYVCIGLAAVSLLVGGIVVGMARSKQGTN